VELALVALGVVVLLVVVGLFIPGVGDVIGDILDGAVGLVFVLVVLLVCGGCVALGLFFAGLADGPG
jgi:hypothetical protein